MIKRPYQPIGTEPEFDKIVDRLLKESRILNPSQRTKDIKMAGYSTTNREQLQASKTDIQERLDEFKVLLTENADQTTRYNQQKIASGRQDPEVTIEKPDAKSKRLELEAKQFVLLREEDQVEKWILIASVKKEKVDLSLMLIRGTIGVSCRPHGVIQVDGQRVRMNKKVLVIDCTASPYHRISMHEYLTKNCFSVAQIKSKT